MVAAGSSLLAELPSEPVPTLAAVPDVPTSAAPAPAEPAGLKTTVEPASGPDSASAQIPKQTASLAKATWPLLQQKQKELEQLQEEVGRLRNDLGVASLYQTECLLAEVSLKKLSELDPEIQGQGETLSVVELMHNLQQHHSLSTPQFRALEQCLKSIDAMKTLAKPSLMLMQNQPTTFFSVGAVPVPTGKEAIQPVTYREVGTFVMVTVKPVESGKLNVNFLIEHSTADERHAIRLQGEKIPGIASRRFKSTWEVSPGQTILTGGETLNEQGEPICLLAAFTIIPVENPQLMTAPPALQPIPEPSPSPLR